MGEQEDAGRVSGGQASQAVVFNLNVGKNEQGQCCGLGMFIPDPPKKDKEKTIKLEFPSSLTKQAQPVGGYELAKNVNCFLFEGLGNIFQSTDKEFKYC